MPDTRDLSILIVNWNSVHLLEKCLQSIFENASDLNFEIVVVDNASFDGSQAMVKDRFPQVHFIQNPVNEGFARANNRGFRHSNGRFVLFLNPDTEILGTALTEMVRFLERKENAGIVGPRLLNSDHSIQTTSIMRFPSILTEALDVGYLHRAFPSCPLWNVAPLFTDPDNGGVAVQAISGACMMIRRNAFEQVGQFSTNYFMFTEDLDLCYKALRTGWQTYYFGGASVVHHGGGSTASAPDGFRFVMIQTAHVQFLRTHQGRASAICYRFAMLLSSVARIMTLGALLIVTFGQCRKQYLVNAISKWVTVFRWATGLGRNPATFLPHCSDAADSSSIHELPGEEGSFVLEAARRVKDEQN